MKRLLLFIASLFIVATASAQNQYFVNTSTGSDANAGTSSGAAWKTISHSIASFALGTPVGGVGAIINVAPGTYNENISFTRGGSSISDRLVIKCTAQWSVPSSAGCKLRGVGGNDTPYTVPPGGANNVDFGAVGRFGFDITNVGQANGYSYGLTLQCNLVTGTTGNCNSGNSFHILGNYFHDLSASASPCETNPNGHHAISFNNHHGPYMTDAQVIGNRITNIGNQTTSALNGGPGCINYYGLYMETQGYIVANNIWINIAGYAVHAYSSPCSGTISGNTIINTELSNILVGGGDCNNGTSSGSITVSNNIMGRNDSGEPHLQWGVPGTGTGGQRCSATHPFLGASNVFLDSTNQVGYDLTATQACTTMSGTTTSTTGAIFVGFTGSGGNNDDLHIKSGSPADATGSTSCVLNGLSPCVISPDQDGVARNLSTPARGAFEFTSSASPTVTGVSPSSGTTLGGTAVTITGTNFVSGATVSFGGTAATGTTVVSSTSITTTSPAHLAGSVNVTVTLPSLLSGTDLSAYSYINPAPTLASVSPNNGTNAGGTTVTLTGTGFLSGAAVTFGGTAGTSVVVTSSTSLTVHTPAHATGAVNVVITNTDTQNATLTSGYTFNLPAPAPTVTGISPTSGPSVGGTAVTVTGTSFVAGASVSIGGQPATSVVFVNSTSLTCVTPPGTVGAQNVTVTNPDTQTGTDAGAFTYIFVAIKHVIRHGTLGGVRVIR